MYGHEAAYLSSQQTSGFTAETTQATSASTCVDTTTLLI